MVMSTQTHCGLAQGMDKARDTTAQKECGREGLEDRPLVGLRVEEPQRGGGQGSYQCGCCRSHMYIYIYIYSLTNKHMLHMLHHQQPSAHDKNTSVLKTHALTSFPQPFCRRTSPSAFRGSTWGCPFPAGMKLMCVRGVGVTHALRCSWESRLPFDLVPPGSCHRQKCIQATVPQMGGTILLDDRLSI